MEGVLGDKNRIIDGLTDDLDRRKADIKELQGDCKGLMQDKLAFEKQLI
jgi:hypothetical protein